MSLKRWMKMGLLGSLAGQSACLGETQTPLATPADLRPAPATGGWTVENTFGDVSFEQFQAGEMVIVPLRAVRKPEADRHDLRRSAFTYQVDLPDTNMEIRKRYRWGGEPLSNGLSPGSFHWHHERLAFDMKSHKVFVLPRRGLANVDRKEQDTTRFWCIRDAVRSQTVAIDSWYDGRGDISRPEPGDVCPTAFVRTTGETKGVPLLVGTQKETYVIDTPFIAVLIDELHLDTEVSRAKSAEDMNRQLTTIANAQEQEQRALAAERIRTAGSRGQAMIDRGEIGARLCADLQVGPSPAIVSTFLESIRGENVQLRVNSVQSPDGNTTFTLTAPIDGILYSTGNLVWSNRRGWRACD
jgi:hypothetical protein